jgi:hypothetical protein
MARPSTIMSRENIATSVMMARCTVPSFSRIWQGVRSSFSFFKNKFSARGDGLRFGFAGFGGWFLNDRSKRLKNWLLFVQL